MQKISHQTNNSSEKRIRKEEPKMAISEARLIRYNEKNFEEVFLSFSDEIHIPIKKDSVAWLNIDRLHEKAFIERVTEYFKLHHLTLEDILNTKHPSKIDIFEDHIFLVFKMLYRVNDVIIPEQISIVLGKGFVLSFQEKKVDVLNIVQERIRDDKGKIRKLGSDYLVYSLIDAIVDSYFSILEEASEDIEKVEERIFRNPSHSALADIHRFKASLIVLRRSIWPLREMLNQLQRDDTGLLGKQNMIYFRDISDHIMQLIDSVEILRDVASEMLSVYMSSMSNRMNEVMKVLTIFASVFIPLTFLAGVYGMNFDFMPELRWRIGYPLFWVISFLVGGIMFFYFRKKKWM